MLRQEVVCLHAAFFSAAVYLGHCAVNVHGPLDSRVWANVDPL